MAKSNAAGIGGDVRNGAKAEIADGEPYEVEIVIAREKIGGGK